ncbi:Gfo/Idh/MocA family oxidoreductase [Spirillospora sp. NPDC047279]|uniref:Gfo/Idh/MocA family protein n=1 Tax=Spirillospora sp. NPDC047279 TaxID=3155478 RepID=UPI0033E9EA20
MLRLALVGAGIMGAHHARVAAGLPGVELVMVADPDAERGGRLAASAGAEYTPDYGDVVGRADAAVVAAPSELHARIGTELLGAGLDVLVEKPIATTPEDAKRLIAAAAAAGRILMIGHVERFNPAVVELPRLVDGLIHVDVRRVGPYGPRADADVILDLMIHDLDLLRMLTRSEPVRVHALTRRVCSQTEDFATVMLGFADGVTATLTASQVSQAKQRQIELTQRDNVVVADLLLRQVTVHRLQHAEFVDEDGPRYRQSSVIEIPYLSAPGEPLAHELRHFVECVGTRSTPVVSGEDGLAALELALRVHAEATREEIHV